jgi:hypothetical protein
LQDNWESNIRMGGRRGIGRILLCYPNTRKSDSSSRFHQALNHGERTDQTTDRRTLVNHSISELAELVSDDADLFFEFRSRIRGPVRNNENELKSAPGGIEVRSVKSLAFSHSRYVDFSSSWASKCRPESPWPYLGTRGTSRRDPRSWRSDLPAFTLPPS